MHVGLDKKRIVSCICGIRDGIHDSFRGIMWSLLCGAASLRKDEYYSEDESISENEEVVVENEQKTMTIIVPHEAIVGETKTIKSLEGVDVSYVVTQDILGKPITLTYYV